MASEYRIQIIDKDGLVVEFEPGRSIEKELVSDIVRRLKGKGVGLFRTTSHVELDVRSAIEEAIFELKAKVKP